MNANIVTYSFEEFQRFAGRDISRWSLLNNQRILHRFDGELLVRRICVDSSGDISSVIVTKLGREYRIDGDAFFSSIEKLHLTQEVIFVINEIREKSRLEVEERAKRLEDEAQRLRSAKSERIRLEEIFQKEEQASRQTLIQNFCREHGITTLLHFTQAANLFSILKEGLLSRQTLEERSYIREPRFNDDLRLDERKDAICLSISFPNYKLFYTYRKRNPTTWAVILLDARILWELDCAFYRENAASHWAREQSIDHLRKYEALQSMFDDFGTIRRASLRIPDNYPTNPQAEVLVMDNISTEYIKEIHFEHGFALDQWIGVQTKVSTLPILACSRYFQRRIDYDWWRKTSTDPYQDMNPETFERISEPPAWLEDAPFPTDEIFYEEE